MKKNFDQDDALVHSLISLALPDGILDYFELIKIKEVDSPKQQRFTQYVKTLNVYLEELDNRTPDLMNLRPNGFTRYTCVNDFPLRNRLLNLYIRRRRYEDEEGNNIILSKFPIKPDGTGISSELADILKDVR